MVQLDLRLETALAPCLLIDLLLTMRSMNEVSKLCECAIIKQSWTSGSTNEGVLADLGHLERRGSKARYNCPWKPLV